MNNKSANLITPPQWISVEDRYPEVDQDVVYFFNVCGTYVGKYLGEHCFAGEAGFLTDDVTHWMPYRKPTIPLPYLNDPVRAARMEEALIAAHKTIQERTETDDEGYRDYYWDDLLERINRALLPFVVPAKTSSDTK